jgi:hypothetical protein
MVKKSPPPPQKSENGRGHGPKTDGADDLLFVSLIQGKLEERLRIIGGPLASHVLPSTLDRLMQEKGVYEDLLEFIKTAAPGKQQLVDFVARQVRVLKEKLPPASERDREHLQYQIEIYLKALERPSLGPPGVGVFK